jgi:transcriptional regulator with XRE-family HTH domain
VNPIEDGLVQPGGLAARLRDLRLDSKMSGKEFAEAAGWAQSKVSRIENGRQLPSAEDIRKWADVLVLEPALVVELNEQLADLLAARNDWRRRAHQGQVAIQADYNRLAAESTLIRQFDTASIPGLLQTPGYARQMLAQAIILGHLERDDVEPALALRLQRQQALYDPGKRFEFLIDEAVLRRLVCPPPVMRGQLDRLQTMVGMPNIRLGIVPLGMQLEIVPQNGFVLYDDLAFAETFTSEGVCSEEESAAYARILDLLWQDAVTEEAARRLIVAAAHALDMP